MREALRVAQLVMILSSDWPTSPLDAVYIHGLSHGMLEAPKIFELAARLYHEGKAPFIAFNGGDGSPFGLDAPGTSWPGMAYYYAELTRRGVPAERLVHTGPAPHTREEINQLIITAKVHEWKRIGIINIPYAYARTFCYLPEPMKVHGWRPDCFALNPPSTDWYLPMGASQGQGTTTPFDAAYQDALKVLQHIGQGWASPLGEVFPYLEKRKR